MSAIPVQASVPCFWIVACEFDPFPGGQATYAREVAQALVRGGRKVVVIAPRYADVRSESSGALTIKRVLKHQSLDPLSALRLWSELRHASLNDKILTCDIRAGVLVSCMPGLKARWRAAMFHGGEILRAGRGWLPLMLNRLSVKGANHLVANSAFSAALVERHIERPCEVITLGVSPYWHGQAEGPFENAVLRSIHAKDTVACLVARIERRKGHVKAIEAMLHMGLQNRAGFKFVFAGRSIDADYTEEIKRFCSQYPDVFLYAGEVSRDDVRRLYRRSRLLVLAAQPEPDRIEGFGLVITEAGAQGCPSVATRVGGIADAVQHQRSGLLCDHDNPDELGDAIVRLLDDDQLRHQLSQGATTFARSLSWTRVADRTFLI